MTSPSGKTADALIVAAGRGQRFGGSLPKQYASLAGVPLLRHTLQAFAAHPAIGRVRAVIHPDDRDLYDAAAAGLNLAEPVAGGASRQESVLRGLESLAERAPARVLIHDGARPFVSAPVVDRVLAALDKVPGAIAALPVVDTLKRGQDDHIAGTQDRAGLWGAQTPQGFRYAEILAAHRAAAGEELTDDAAVAERAGIEVALVEGSRENFKVTSQDDLRTAERWLRGAPGQGGAETRVGQGFDVHAFGPGDHVMLCGVRIDHDAGLAGHSDADVGLHALTDAILGALGAGDIGSHFPPSDPQWKGADSGKFIRHARDLVTARGGRILHLDVTLVCERPKVGPHRDAMVARVAELLDLPADRVSVKATTTEKLGFTGRGEGIAAQAAATLALPPSD
ncbi:bifunctional 2-C-methyl-D-erythritol 4-phosphate cytidylyltransferase/2-C-methyl-D-erythritol 2,4-cyclodiphosphate synthase [Pelagibius marinus]|uniref:bifunctional 2-C-methyl-D-erythritol 4-phosphate cytidylyltransferase/2-C-methyl-D-erythritol 2,4-cyclodiphosphate synthase n=1 Tax=Pelagibius marinus TaxID=2762760 RepID=UPI001872181B|nr:bifunctional 2-C-methyl-D-erythritol 4-phosphate cytidylyltransferase/2-C-methyl-D-erythritol 2,4-cyclodiphosphate synthase [Pelagibius marinus]